jgi:hypothetical protein
MPKPQREGERSRWETAGLRIGVVSGAVGLAVSIVGLPKSVADALKHQNSASARLDLQQKRAEAVSAGPRLEVKYLFLSTELLTEQANTSKVDQKAGSLAASSPVVANEVMNESDVDSLFGAGHGCRYSAGYPSTSVAFLEIDNRGRRDAENVAVILDHFRLGGPARIREATRGGDDYVAKIRAQAKTTDRVTVRIPRTLGPGDGVRVPLFVSDAPYERYDLWCVASRTAFLPRSIRFTDSAFRTTTQSAVRRMQSPLVIGRGVFDRG